MKKKGKKKKKGKQQDDHYMKFSDERKHGGDDESVLLVHQQEEGVVEKLSRVRYRVVGFREYIYTGVGGGSAEQMSNAETTFGTIFQRTLANPLNARLHYGHPDFFDAFWVINRGMLSKASPNINLSEDVFAGFNIFGRGEHNGHTDILEWQKGREENFMSASGKQNKKQAKTNSPPPPPHTR